MGCDIHGYWELFHPAFNRWVVIKPINDSRSYEWFGIIAGVRRDGPNVDGDDVQPNIDVHSPIGVRAKSGKEDDDEDFSRAWVEYCKRWGHDLHSHRVLSRRAVMEANTLMWGRDEEERSFNHNDHPSESDRDPEALKEKAPRGYHEEVPWADDVIQSLIFETQYSEDYSEQTPIELPMNIPLGEIIGSYDEEVLNKRIRMVVAFDN